MIGLSLFFFACAVGICVWQLFAGPLIQDHLGNTDDPWAALYAYLRPYPPFSLWANAHDEEGYVKTQALLDRANESYRLSPETYWVKQVVQCLTAGFFGLIVFLFATPFTHFFFWFVGVGEATPGVILMTQMISGTAVLWFPVLSHRRLKKHGKRRMKRVKRSIPLSQTNLYFAVRNGGTVDDILYEMGSDKGSLFAPNFRRAFLYSLSDRKKAFDYLKRVFKGTNYIQSIRLLENAHQYYPLDLLRSLENERYTMNEELKHEQKQERMTMRAVSTLFQLLPVISLVGFIGILLMSLMNQFSDVLF